jgi:hypothetical protein
MIPRYCTAMTHRGFDAAITQNDHHLATAGMADRPTEAGAAVRRALDRMDGAGSIDVEAQSYPANLPGLVILFPPGRAVAPDTPEWRDRRGNVELLVTAALIGAGVPF